MRKTVRSTFFLVLWLLGFVGIRKEDINSAFELVIDIVRKYQSAKGEL
jgi:hypothetical protein